MFALALENNGQKGSTKDSDSCKLLSELFEIEQVSLGDNPKQKLTDKVAKYQAEHPYSPQPSAWLPEYHIERYPDEYFVIGSYHNQAHWDWITGKNDRGSHI